MTGQRVPPPWLWPSSVRFFNSSSAAAHKCVSLDKLSTYIMGQFACRSPTFIETCNRDCRCISCAALDLHDPTLLSPRPSTMRSHTNTWVLCTFRLRIPRPTNTSASSGRWKPQTRQEAMEACPEARFVKQCFSDSFCSALQPRVTRISLSRLVNPQLQQLFEA